MNEEQLIENYLSISSNKFGIYLLDVKNLKILYKKELVINENDNSLDFSFLKNFLMIIFLKLKN